MPSLGDGRVEDVLALLAAHARDILRRGERALGAIAPGPGAAALCCAADAALLDLEGQRRGVPVARLLAEDPLRAVPANAVIGSGAADETVRFAREAVDAGYSVLKLKVGVGDLDSDVARVEAVRWAFPDVAIRLDANGAWTEARARDAIERLAPLRVELIEQPVRVSAVAALRRLRRLRRADLVPIAADEAVTSIEAARRLLDADATDLLVLKPMRLGGIRPSLEIARLAATHGVAAFVTTTFDSSVGTAVALQLAAAVGVGRPADGLSTGEHLADDLVRRPLVPRRGVLRLPARAGLGVAVDPQAVGRLAAGPWTEVHARRR